MGDFVLLHIVVQLNAKPAGQLIEHDGLVHVVPTPGDVVALAVDVGQLHLFGKQVKVVEGHGGSKIRSQQ